MADLFAAFGIQLVMKWLEEITLSSKHPRQNSPQQYLVDVHVLASIGQVAVSNATTKDKENFSITNITALKVCLSGFLQSKRQDHILALVPITNLSERLTQRDLLKLTFPLPQETLLW